MFRLVLVSKAFRFRVYPTPAQVARLDAWEGALRFLWNLALEQRKIGLARPRDERRYPTAFDQINELTELRTALLWLADVPRNVCSQLLVELDRAWQRCFAKLARAPRWKRKGRDALSFCEPHPKTWRLDGDSIRFPKIGSLRTVLHRPLEGKPKTCTLKRDGDQWFASVVCELDVPGSAPRDGPVLAIDRGLANFGATSDGDMIANPRNLEASLVRLARAQRNVSRKKKGSRNREKAKARVARIHRKVRRQRDHFLHVQSARLAKSHGVVVLEKLNVAGMIRSTLRKKHRRRGMVPLRRDAPLQARVVRRLARRGARRLQRARRAAHAAASTRESRRSQSVFRCTSCGYRTMLTSTLPRFCSPVRIARASLLRGPRLRRPDEAGNGLDCVFHVVLPKAPPFRPGLITVGTAYLRPAS